jgi:rhamnogalacturonan endolyase
MLKSIFFFVWIPFLFPLEMTSQNEVTPKDFNYEKNTLFYQNDFENNLSDFIVETKISKTAKVKIEKGKLIIDVDRGATVWLNKKLSGNILIEYTRKVILRNGANDRLSDLNQFWMANDPKNPDLFIRKGNFEEYDSLQLYYFGIGGNRNTTSRFRKYLGNGERVLIHDYKENKYMLQPNKTYLIQTVCYNGSIRVFVDHKEYFYFSDENPLTSGFFGIRTTESRQEIDNLRIYSLN